MHSAVFNAFHKMLLTSLAFMMKQSNVDEENLYASFLFSCDHDSKITLIG